MLNLTVFSQGVYYPVLKKYNTADGLASYNVKKIIQDHNGFIWIATQGGLSRFDSRSFVTYTRNSSPGKRLNGSDIREVIEDTVTKTIWVLATEGGFNGIDITTGRVKTSSVIPYPIPETFSLSMTLMNNKLWIGSFNGVKIYDIETRQFEPDPLLPSVSDRVPSGYFEAGKIFSDHLGNIWTCYCGYGIIIYDKKSRSILKKIPLQNLNDYLKTGNIKFNDYLFLNNNELLLATSHGIRKLKFTDDYRITIDNQPCSSQELINREPIESIEKETENTILVASLMGLYRFDSHLDSYELLKENEASNDGNWLNSIHYIFSDNRKNVLLGCQQGLALFSSRKPEFKKFYQDEQNKQKLEHVRSIVEIDSFTLLVGLMNGLATVHKKSNSISIYNSQNTYHHVFRDPLGQIQVSRADGMFVFRNNTLIPLHKIYPEFTKYYKNPTNSHVLIEDSLLLMGTENEKGVLVWNYKSRSVREITHSLGFNVVNNIYKDNSKNIWVLSDKKITILNHTLMPIKTFELYDKEGGRPAIFYFDICESNGYYWITSYGTGIIQVDAEYKIISILTKINGLSDEGVYQVFPYADLLIVTTNNGLSSYNIKTGKFKNYYQQDGLHSNNFEEVAGFARNSLIYAGGVKGFTEIDPDRFSINPLAPKIFITNIQIKTRNSLIDTSDILLTSLKIPNNVLQTTLYFSAINYQSPERTTIVYRLKEQNSDWIAVENSVLPLIGLGPGVYHVQVKASNEDGIWSNPIELKLIFLPKWYQTWLFKAFLVLVAIGIIYIIYRVRINQLKKEEKIRRQLASDLHDDLGSTLNSIKVYSNLAMMNKEQPQHLLKVKESTQEAITGIRDMIWVLDDKKDAVEHLLTRVGHFASPLCEANGIRFVQQVDETAYHHKLAKEEKRNLYMILKEFINNSIKYAAGDTIQLTVTREGKKVNITVSDNGKGFDKENMTEGNGLKNMLSRSGEIGYKCNIITSPGNGTKLQLQKS